MKPVLQVLQPVYYSMQKLRNKMYDKGILDQVKLSIPVISVGNISFGGTGKTPFVQWLCSTDLLRSKKVAVLSRAYKAEFSGDIRKITEQEQNKPELYGDEACMLASSLPQVDVFVCNSKSHAAQKIDAMKKYDLLLVDDAFQHRRLLRDLDIVLLDASVGQEAYQRFPKGELREDLEALERAEFLVYTKADSAEPELKQVLEKRLSLEKASAVFSFQLNKPMRITPSNSIEMIDSDKPEYLLVTGVGNPQQVAKSFKAKFGEEKSSIIYKDHHVFTLKDIELMEQKLTQVGAKYIFCTEKDYLKIKNLMKNSSALYYVPMKNEALKGEKELVEKISSLFS